ncbi:hypothetical protein ABPG75_000286 [Micractinium tetrahymenae]
MADALERLEPVPAKPALLRRAARAVQEVSLLSRWHRTAARSATLRLSLRWKEEWGQASLDAACGAARLRGRVEEVCLDSPLPTSRQALVSRLTLLGSQLPGPAPGLLGCITSLTLTHLKEGPEAYQAVFRASQLPGLPRLSTLRLLYYRRAYLAGLGPSVQHVHLTAAGAYMEDLGRRGRQVVGEVVSPLGSLPAHRLASLSIEGNLDFMDLDRTGSDRPRGTVVLLDVAQLCSAAQQTSIRVHTLGLPVPRAALALPAEEHLNPSAGTEDRRTLGFHTFMGQCLLEGGAEQLDVRCWAFRCHHAFDAPLSITPPPASRRQMAAVAAASFAAAAGKEAARHRAMEQQRPWALAVDSEAWERAAEAANAEAEAGGAGLVHHGRDRTLAVNKRMTRAAALQLQQEQRENACWQEELRLRRREEREAALHERMQRPIVAAFCALFVGCSLAAVAVCNGR